METRPLGSLNVTIVGIGCNNFGGRIDADATKLVVDAAIDAGINFFDTADVYGGTKSELYLGQALGSKRSEVLIATKFGYPVDEQHQGATPEYVKQACEDSLRRLGTDYIDLYQLHRPDSVTPFPETLAALQELVAAGKVREIGVSNFSAAQLQEGEEAAKGGPRVVSVQNNYSLFKRDPEPEVLPECAKLGIGFLPYFPLASGLLSGKYRLGQPVPDGVRIKADSDALSEENLKTVEKLIQYSEAHGHTILDLAFGWLLYQPTVSSVIAGATKPEQVNANAGAVGWKLTAAEIAEVDGILKG